MKRNSKTQAEISTQPDLGLAVAEETIRVGPLTNTEIPLAVMAPGGEESILTLQNARTSVCGGIAPPNSRRVGTRFQPSRWSSRPAAGALSSTTTARVVSFEADRKLDFTSLELDCPINTHLEAPHVQLQPVPSMNTGLFANSTLLRIGRSFEYALEWWFFQHGHSIGRCLVAAAKTLVSGIPHVETPRKPNYGPRLSNGKALRKTIRLQG